MSEGCFKATRGYFKATRGLFEGLRTRVVEPKMKCGKYHKNEIKSEVYPSEKHDIFLHHHHRRAAPAESLALTALLQVQ